MLWKARGKLIDRKAKDFHRECMQTCWKEIPLHRVARKADYFFVPVEPTLAFSPPAESESSMGGSKVLQGRTMSRCSRSWRARLLMRPPPEGSPHLLSLVLSTPPLTLQAPSTDVPCPGFSSPANPSGSLPLSLELGRVHLIWPPPILKHVRLPQLP